MGEISFSLGLEQRFSTASSYEDALKSWLNLGEY